MKSLDKLEPSGINLNNYILDQLNNVGIMVQVGWTGPMFIVGRVGYPVDGKTFKVGELFRFLEGILEDIMKIFKTSGSASWNCRPNCLFLMIY